LKRGKEFINIASGKGFLPANNNTNFFAFLIIFTPIFKTYLFEIKDNVGNILDNAWN
jgi:hypothetical protein